MNLIDIIRTEGIVYSESDGYYKINCPFHDDAIPSVTIYKNSPEWFKCWGCGEKGGTIKFIMQYKKFNYSNAIKYLGIKLNESYLLKKKPTTIELVVNREKEGKKYPKWLVDLLLAKELVNLSYRREENGK